MEMNHSKTELKIKYKNYFYIIVICIIITVGVVTMIKIRTGYKFLLVFIAVSLIVSGCSFNNQIDKAPTPPDSSNDSDPGVIKDNLFVSELLGIEMALPGEWFIVYNVERKIQNSGFNRVMQKSQISGFDSTIEYTVSSEKIVDLIVSTEQIAATFTIDKYEESKTGTTMQSLIFLATKREPEDNELEQAVRNMKNGFTDTIEYVFEDMPDIFLDDLIIKRFKVIHTERSNYIEIMHVALLDDFKIVIWCINSVEEDYKEIEEIVSTIKKR